MRKRKRSTGLAPQYIGFRNGHEMTSSRDKKRKKERESQRAWAQAPRAKEEVSRSREKPFELSLAEVARLFSARSSNRFRPSTADTCRGESKLDLARSSATMKKLQYRTRGQLLGSLHEQVSIQRCGCRTPDDGLARHSSARRHSDSTWSRQSTMQSTAE